MRKVGVSTVHTGFNYGSALQAYAGKLFLNKMGYDGNVVSLKGTLIKGRDIRLKKLIIIAGRVMLHPKKMLKRAQAYNSCTSTEYSEKTMQLFNDFRLNNIKPLCYSWKELKKTANSNEFFAYLCGSDQIWNGDILYVDPQYYLRYAPERKRIAFAPSFGRNKVADYNEKKVRKYINEIPSLSVREASGKKIIKDLTGRDAEHLVDPTLMISKDEWTKELDLNDNMGLDSDYILAYFLNEPSENAKSFIQKLKKKYNMEVIALPYERNKADWFTRNYNAGPIEFLKLINNAKVVCTDSFHGTAFSINLHTPYYVFDREYGKAAKQSSRIESLLNLVDQMERFNPDDDLSIEFEYSEKILNREREKALNYLEKSFEKVNKFN